MRKIHSLFLLPGLLFMSCSEPDPIRSDELVESPFVLEVDTLQQVSAPTAGMDTVGWNTFGTAWIGETDAYLSGLVAHFDVGDSLWRDTTLQEVNFLLILGDIYVADPGDSLTADSISITLNQTDLTSFHPSLSPGTELGTYRVGGQLNGTTWNLPLDTTYLAADTLISLGLTAAEAGWLASIYGPTSAIRPQLHFHHLTPYLNADSAGIDSSFTYIVLPDSMTTVIEEQNGFFDPAYHYLKQMSGETLNLDISLADWYSDTLRLRRVLDAQLLLNADSAASRIYPESPGDTLQRIELQLLNTATKYAETLIIDESLSILENQVANLLQAAVNDGTEILSLTLRLADWGEGPSFVAFPADAAWITRARAQSSLTEVPQ